MLKEQQFMDTGRKLDLKIGKAKDTPTPQRRIVILTKAFEELDHKGLRPEDYGYSEENIRSIVDQSSFKSENHHMAIDGRTQGLINLYFNK